MTNNSVSLHLRRYFQLLDTSRYVGEKILYFAMSVNKIGYLLPEPLSRNEPYHFTKLTMLCIPVAITVPAAMNPVYRFSDLCLLDALTKV